MPKELGIWEDVWIPTQCARCYCNCAIRVRRVNRVAVKIEGEPDSTMGARGGLCAKGEAGLQVLYDPNRLNTPLRRTNPEKGLYVDPKWKEITWEEAFDEIVPRLKKIKSEDPRKLIYYTSPLRTCRLGQGEATFRGLFGASVGLGGGAVHCGNGAHVEAGMVYASWSSVPDFRYCNYALYFGAGKGFGSGHSATITARLAADAKARGMKIVVFDPVCIFGGAKATEWTPLIPGTDAAIILAICNVIVNELGIWDAPYLKTKTNAPYLIGPDGRYVRAKETGRPSVGEGKTYYTMYGVETVYLERGGKPLVWDASEGKAKAYDDPSIIDYALEGSYEVNGVKCQPAFQLVKEHLKQYTPEMASKVSTVPAETIHRIATEFAQAAQIGSTITIEGHQLPFRPASAVVFRGGEGHENSHHTCFATALLGQIIGGADVPGGTLGWPARSLGYPGTGKPYFSPGKDGDGFLTTDHFGPVGGLRIHPGPWPPHMPENRHGMSLLDIFTLAPYPTIYNQSDQDEIWQKIGCPIRPEMLIVWAVNIVISAGNRDIVAENLKKVPFIVVTELFNTELTEGFADIVLPEACYLENETFSEGFTGQNFNHAFGMDDWCYHIMQPVVKPAHNRKPWDEVIYELIDRLGLRKEYNNRINDELQLADEYKLKPTEKFTPAELADRVAKNLFGPEHDWEWFKKHGFLRWKKRVEEAYWRYFIDARVPIYLEYMVDIGEKIREIVKETGLDVDCSQYTPLISWFPCSIHRVDNAEYDLYCFSYRDTLHTGSHTMEQPWIDEASRMNPYTYNITMNRDTAARKGLKDGDTIEIESNYGRKVEGTLKVMNGQHPQVVGIAACSGHWAKGLPVAKGKGTNFDVLLELDLKHVDPVSLNVEVCARVKVRKVERS